MRLFKWMFRVQWDAIRRQGQELEDAEHAMRELRTCLVLAKDARVEWEKRAVAAEKRAAEPTEPRPIDGELGERVSEMRRLYMIVNEGGTEKLISWEQAKRKLTGLCLYLAPDLADTLESQGKPRPMSEALFCTGTHRHSFRPGEYAEVIGAEMFAPDGAVARPVFVLRYADGVVDEMAIESPDHALHGRPVGWIPTTTAPGGSEEGE